MNRLEGNNVDTTSSDEEEDEEAKELTEDVEKNFFKTLSCLKKNDPKIYDETVKFFDSSTIQDSSGKSNKSSTSTSNPIYLEEYKRKILLERGPEFDDTEEVHEVLEKNQVRMSSPSYVEEQKAIKESFRDALYNSDDEEVLKRRVKTKEEQEKEDKDYLEWLKGNKDELDDEETKKDLQHLHDYWNNPNLEEGEQFLCDYILNKRFLESKDEYLVEDEMRFSEEDEMLEKHEEFEHKYNFRFEEPDKEFIKTYPRTMENSLRRKEEKRKAKREEQAMRKKDEMGKRSLEIKKLKKIKKQEIVERIRKLQEITGNKGVGFEDAEIEADFNPTEYDRKMHQLFDEEFYDQVDDDSKPVFDKEEDEFIMDCEYDPSLDRRNKKKTRAAKRKEKKKILVKEIEDDDEESSSKQKIPKYDPAMGSFEKYIDEYYSLDCEDIVSGVPTRYSYNKVIPNDYGLTIEEILLADDKDLNKWYPIGKLSKIQPEAVQKFEAKIYKRKANDIELKKKLLPSLFIEENKAEENEENDVNKKEKKKKKSKSIFKNTEKNCDQKKNEDSSNIKLEIKLDPKSIKSDKKSEKSENEKPRNKTLKKEKKSVKQNAHQSSNGVNNKPLVKVDNINKCSDQAKDGDSSNKISEIKLEVKNLKSIKSPKKSENSKNVKPQNKKAMKKENKNIQQNSDKTLNGVNTPSVLKVDKYKNQTKIQGSINDKSEIKFQVKNTKGYKGVKRKLDQFSNRMNKRKKMAHKNYRQTKEPTALESMTDDRLQAYGINPKKFRNKLKFSNSK
ncbi:protein KRI1 homolog [Adelges cooleyi]|uniref:protein KRI1 homolog n=1 Tax=Adelges cooleyi TaxID=133065 RepID=UPI00217F68F6|nr:protein KRI1 homolog [Adelges cooleyi]